MLESLDRLERLGTFPGHARLWLLFAAFSQMPFEVGAARVPLHAPPAAVLCGHRLSVPCYIIPVGRHPVKVRVRQPEIGDLLGCVFT